MLPECGLGGEDGRNPVEHDNLRRIESLSTSPFCVDILIVLVVFPRANYTKRQYGMAGGILASYVT